MTSSMASSGAGAGACAAAKMGVRANTATRAVLAKFHFLVNIICKLYISSPGQRFLRQGKEEIRLQAGKIPDGKAFRIRTPSDTDKETPGRAPRSSILIGISEENHLVRTTTQSGVKVHKPCPFVYRSALNRRKERVPAPPCQNRQENLGRRAG